MTRSTASRLRRSRRNYFTPTIIGTPTKEPLNRVFVYGIFLGEKLRDRYGMSNPVYATVDDYATFGTGIVQAQYIPDAGLGLTGLIVDIDPSYWDKLDSLEGGYDRKLIVTDSYEEAWMYVAKQK